MWPIILLGGLLLIAARKPDQKKSYAPLPPEIEAPPRYAPQAPSTGQVFAGMADEITPEELAWLEDNREEIEAQARWANAIGMAAAGDLDTLQAWWAWAQAGATQDLWPHLAPGVQAGDIEAIDVDERRWSSTWLDRYLDHLEARGETPYQIEQKMGAASRAMELLSREDQLSSLIQWEQMRGFSLSTGGTGLGALGASATPFDPHGSAEVIAQALGRASAL